MPISPEIKSNADRELLAYCESKFPIQIRDRVRLSTEWHGSKVTIFEHRPFLMDQARWSKSPVAQLRFDAGSQLWLLFCSDRNHRWHPYSGMPSSKELHKLITAIEHDETCIFWG